MKYLLIDTNCWVDLLRNESEEENLKVLEYWILNGSVVLLVPEILKSEWQKQRQFHLSEIKRQNKKAFETVNTITKKFIIADYNHVENKASIIDRLIAKGKSIKVSSAVHAEVSKRFVTKSAPFHSNQNSHNDAYIYLSSIEYLKKRKISNLIFATRNRNEFGDPIDPLKTLHSDLIFNDVIVEYYYEIGLCVSTQKKELGAVSLSSEHDVDFISQFKFVTDNTNNIIDQVYQSLNKYNDQLPFVPGHLLVKIFPFKVSSSKYSYTYHSSFRINSNNEELVQLFKDILIGKNNKLTIKGTAARLRVKDKKEKLFHILNKLNSNLIYEIGTVGGQIETDLRLKETNLCDCVSCTYKRLDFHTSFSKLKFAPDNNLHETIKHAYVHFQFGNYVVALKLYHDAFERCKKENKAILSFICLYNLKRLKSYIRGTFSKTDTEADMIIKKVDNTSLKRVRIGYAGEDIFVQETIGWIAENNFFSEAFQNITSIIEKIKDHYYLQLGGGTSNNSNFWNLLSEFANLEYFLDKNYIIYDNYQEFEEVADKFLEGILMTYSFNDKQSIRIEYIDEYILLKAITYCKRETIIKYYRRLHLISIKHKKNSRIDLSFQELAFKFFSDYKKLKVIYTEKGEGNLFSFWDKYRKIFGNILLVLTLSEEENDLSDVLSQLINVLRDESFLRKFDDVFISDFIREKGQLTNEEVFGNFINLAIENEKLHEAEIFSAINHQVIKFHTNLKISDRKTIAKIKKYFLNECPKCKTFHHTDILVRTYFILDDNLKNHIKKAIIKLLKTDFNPEMFYVFSIYGVIDYKLFLDQFVNSCEVPNSNEIRHTFNRGEAFARRVNELLNLAFKYKIDLRLPQYQKYKVISPYYEWIFDLDEFDYTKFDPLWILEYQTHHFLEKIFSSKKAKGALLNYLKQYKHPKLSEIYFKYDNV